MARLARGIAAVLFGIAIVVVATPALAQKTDTRWLLRTIEPGVLTVATLGQTPMAPVDARTGELSGIDGDILNEVAKRLGLRVTARLMDWAGTIPSVTNNKVDIALHGIYYSDQRDAVMNTSIPIYKYGTVAMQRKGLNVRKWDDLKGKVAATVKGFWYLGKLKTIDGIKEIKEYDDVPTGLIDLAAGRSDAFFGPEPVLRHFMKRNPQAPVAVEPLEDEEIGYVVFLMPVNRDKLTALVNFTVRDLIKDGTVAKILAKYGMDGPRFMVTDKELGIWPADK